MTKNEKIAITRPRRLMLLVALAAVGIALIIFGGQMGGTEENTAETSPESRDAEEYARQTEERVRALCAEVRGAGQVSVYVSLKGGYRTVYAFDTQSTSSGYKSEIVLSGSGSGKSALVTAYENPEIAGVGIVCEGGGSAEVREQIISLVSATLDVGSNKIFVAAAK